METTGDVTLTIGNQVVVFETLCRIHPVVNDVIDDDSVLPVMFTLPISRRRPFFAIWEIA